MILDKMKCQRQSAFLASVLILSVASASLFISGDAHKDFNIVKDISNESPKSVNVKVLGERQQPFDRPAPKSMDPSLLEDFSKEFSFMQDISKTKPNTFTDVNVPYVASIANAYVEGESGLVWDAEGNIYHEKNMFFERTSPNPMPTEITANAIFNATTKVHYPLLATTIQRYGHMYYHFVVETLPKLILLKEAGLPEGTKILMWGESYEQKFLDALDIPREMIVKYDPLKVYTADVLFFPTPVPRITPAKESLIAVRKALGADEALPESERDLIVYCSRSGASTREVANEAEVLQTLRDTFPEEKIVVYENTENVAELINLFKKAKVIIGPHGAGLSHMLFAAPKTKIIEFQFMRDPPMMFWHVAAALNQDYWILPVPNSWWMQKEMNVPVEELVDMMTSILGQGEITSQSCSPGSFRNSEGECEPCGEGTYSFTFDNEECSPCFQGRYASRKGSIACRTCPADTYSRDGMECVPCADNRISWVPGAFSEDQCLSFTEHRSMLRDISLNLQMLHKLSPRSRLVSKRSLIEATTYGEPNAYVPGDGITEQQVNAFSGPTNEEIIEACRMKETFDDPYMSPAALQDLDCSQVSAFARPDTDDEKPHEIHHFVKDKHCVTGYAIRNTKDFSRDTKGRKNFCVACDLPMLLDITKCNGMDATEQCCMAAKAWNNGGCMCAASSHELANEMGASFSLMKALSGKCNFELIGEELDNCPPKTHKSGRLHAAGKEDSAAFSSWGMFVPATIGATMLLMFALFTE